MPAITNRFLITLYDAYERTGFSPDSKEYFNLKRCIASPIGLLAAAKQHVLVCDMHQKCVRQAIEKAVLKTFPNHQWRFGFEQAFAGMLDEEQAMERGKAVFACYRLGLQAREMFLTS